MVTRRGTSDASTPRAREIEAETTGRHQQRLERFRADVLAGLSASPKRIPSKYFYDETGSRMFERICGLEEYYPTRTELAIMQDHAAEMAQLLGPAVLLFEFGSGSSLKTRLLIDHLVSPAAYVPIDISEEHLRESVGALAKDYPGLRVIPVAADFTADIVLPAVDASARRVAYFPGSTLGNFIPENARRFLRRVRRLAGANGALLIGVDLVKDPAILERAYNDRAGVTAAFNRNVLAHVNAALGTNFDCGAFEHLAFYNEAARRIEMHLVARRSQTVELAGRTFVVAAGERILTEYSHKYELREFADLVAEAGFSVQNVWTDEEQLFSVQLLAVVGEPGEDASEPAKSTASPPSREGPDCAAR